MASLMRTTSMTRTGSLSRSSELTASLLPKAPSAAAPRRSRAAASAAPALAARGRGRAVRVRAEKGGDGLGAALQRDVVRFVQRYDPVATGLGSLMVAGWCMFVEGQAPEEALQIGAFATVMGMVSCRFGCR
jgi:hypothetical protein